MTRTAAERSAQAMQSLAQAVQEAANMSAPPASPLSRFGDVVEALAEVALEMRLAYWGYPQPGSVGDNSLLILVDGRELVVVAVDFEGNHIRIHAEPLKPDRSQPS